MADNAGEEFGLKGRYDKGGTGPRGREWVMGGPKEAIGSMEGGKRDRVTVYAGERDCERRGEVEGAGVIGGATEGDEVVWKDRAVLV